MKKLSSMALLLAVGCSCGVREIESKNSCYGNLKTIVGAKETWAADTHASNGTQVSEMDLLPLLGKFPKCPKGGTYQIGSVGQPSTCNHPEHKYAMGGEPPK